MSGSFPIVIWSSFVEICEVAYAFNNPPGARPLKLRCPPSTGLLSFFARTCGNMRHEFALIDRHRRRREPQESLRRVVGVFSSPTGASRNKTAKSFSETSERFFEAESNWFSFYAQIGSDFSNITSFGKIFEKFRAKPIHSAACSNEMFSCVFVKRTPRTGVFIERNSACDKSL